MAECALGFNNTIVLSVESSITAKHSCEPRMDKRQRCLDARVFIGGHGEASKCVGIIVQFEC